MTNERDIESIPPADRDVCPNCKTINDRRKDTECVFCTWVLVAWECPYCKQPNDNDDYPICRACKKDERLYGERSILEMTIDAWWETTCDGETDLVAISLGTAGCQGTHEFRLTIGEATELRRVIDEALLASQLAAMDLDPDPEILALHAPAILASAQAIAAFFKREVHIYLPEGGGDATLTPNAPETDIYLRVDPDGSTVLTDER